MDTTTLCINNNDPLESINEKESNIQYIQRKKNNRRFTIEEDNELRQYVELYGPINWSFIASCMKTRNARQCRERWCQYLSPESNQKPWTKEEEMKLQRLAKEYDKDWSQIGRYFKGRVLSQLRNKYKTIERRNKRKQDDFKKRRKKTPLRTAKFTFNPPIPTVYYTYGQNIEENSDNSYDSYNDIVYEYEYDSCILL